MNRFLFILSLLFIIISCDDNLVVDYQICKTDENGNILSDIPEGQWEINCLNVNNLTCVAPAFPNPTNILFEFNFSLPFTNSFEYKLINLSNSIVYAQSNFKIYLDPGNYSYEFLLIDENDEEYLDGIYKLEYKFVSENSSLNGYGYIEKN